MVEIVKGDLDFQQRTLMTALIVLDVHGRDVVLHLDNTNIKSVHDFAWAKQLKYYWDPDIDNCVIR